jgi:hypothetical protein
MDCGGSDDEVRKQQYDHANGTECLVGSLEEEAARTVRRISPKKPMYEATNGRPERRSILTSQPQNIVYF